MKPCIIFRYNLADSGTDITEVDWETANKHCKSQNDSLVDIHDVQNLLSHLIELQPIWSSKKGQFTPWIAYRGCVRESMCKSSTGSHLTKRTCHILQTNTVGNCYFECKSKNYSYGGCANNVNFFFGLQKSTCLCLCDNTILSHISESAKCNMLCGTTITNGECGGIGYFSMYESVNVSLPDTHFRGFCLTCRQQRDTSNVLLYGKGCNESARGHCVMRNGSVSLTFTMSFASYWMQCRNHNLYIIGDTRQTFCQKENNAWTGFRKYKITNSTFDNDSCYIIETHQNTVNYKKRNCTQKLFFLCKNNIGQRNVPSSEYIRSTKSTTPTALTRESLRTTYKFISNRPDSFPATSFITSTNDDTSLIIATSVSPSPSRFFRSSENMGTIVGVSIAGVAVLIFVVFLTIYLLKRNKLQCMQSNQQQAKRAKVFHNTTYDDLVVTNNRPEVDYANTILENDDRGNICKIEDIYVEKEVEYDHLNTSRQTYVTTQVDDDRYGTASYLEEGSYSTLSQNKNTESDLEYEYSVNNMPY